MEFKSFKDLVVWQKSILLVTETYCLTKDFPREEVYGLTSQIRRAAVSIPANIAEGWGRSSSKSYIQFLLISKASLSELETLFIISNNLEYITAQTHKELTLKTDEIGKMLSGLIKSITNASITAN